MAAAKTVIARRTFVALHGGAYTVVAEGERLPATHPVAKAHPQEFAKATARPAA